MTEEDKYTMLSLLETGKSAKEISAETGISMTHTTRFQRQYKTAKVEETINELIDSDKYLLFKAKQFKDSVPSLKNELNSLTERFEGLDRLKAELQVVASSITTKLNDAINKDITVQELKVASEVLNNLQNAFILNNQTQINVQNNYTSGENESIKYQSLLSDTPTLSELGEL